MQSKQEDLPPFEELGALEAELHQRGLITFDRIFKEATGFYLIKCFLMADYSADKAMFVSDVDVFKNMRDEMGRIRVRVGLQTCALKAFAAETYLNYKRVRVCGLWRDHAGCPPNL
jgi:hypothetical protein